MKVTYLALIFFIQFYIYAQEKSLPKRFESTKFVRNLEKISNPQKRLELIIAKIFNDTNYYNTTSRIILDSNVKDSLNHTCKTVFILKYKDKYCPIDLMKSPKLKHLLKIMTINTISNIKIFKDKEAALFFGNDGLCGVVALSTNSRNIFQRIKKAM